MKRISRRRKLTVYQCWQAANARPRGLKMVAMQRAGRTYAEIGERFGVCNGVVGRLLKRYRGQT